MTWPGGGIAPFAVALAMTAAPARAQNDGESLRAIDLADAPEVTAVPSVRQVALGEVFYLFVGVSHPEGMRVNLPASIALGPTFEEVERVDHMIRNRDGSYTREFELALMAFDVGDAQIPPIEVIYAISGGVRQTTTKPVSIRVDSFVGDGEEELRAAAPPVPVDRRDWTLLYVVASVLAALVLAAFASVLTRLSRRRRRTSPIGTAPDFPGLPHEAALARLSALEASGALDAVDLKPVFHELSEIIRDYVGRVFSFPGLDLTTLEIRNELLTRPGGDAVEQLLSDWLRDCDLVKFANEEATSAQARQALALARGYVDDIRMLSVTPGPAGPTRPSA